MKKFLVFALFLLVSVAWAVAQDKDAAGQAGSSSSSSASPQSPSSSDQSSMPSAGQSSMGQSGAQAGQSGAQAGQSASQADQAGAQVPAGEVTEGCLGGSDPNFTITDKAGTVYKLSLPQGANSSVLTKHIGESVQVQGAVSDSGKASSSASSTGSAASSGSMASGAGAEKSIQVSKIGRGQGTCPASGAGVQQKAPTSK